MIAALPTAVTNRTPSAWKIFWREHTFSVLFIGTTLLFSSVANCQTLPAAPALTWSAVGTSYDGQHWGSSVAATIQVTSKISGYGIVDMSGNGSQSFSPGFAFDVLDFTVKKVDFRLDLLTLAGLTTAPTAVLGNFTGGAHGNGCRGRWCFGVAVRQITNPVNPKHPRIYNAALEIRWGK